MNMPMSTECLVIVCIAPYCTPKYKKLISARLTHYLPDVLMQLRCHLENKYETTLPVANVTCRQRGAICRIR